MGSASLRLDSGGVERAEIRIGEDMNGVIARACQTCGDIGTDQQAAGERRGVGIILPAEQARGANAEQRCGEIAPFPLDDTVAEGIAEGHRAATLGCHYALRANQREQLARHRGGEAGDVTTLHLGPFAVRAGLAQQRVRRHECDRRRTEQLHLLAAHDIRARGIDE